DGTVNVGVGVLSTFHRWKALNTSVLMDAFVAGAPAQWGVRSDTATSEPKGGKLPMSFSVGPLVGPGWVLIGDAAGAINPFNGEGIAYAYETGRIAARHVHNALVRDDPSLLHGYPRELQDEYGLYYRVARAFVSAIGRPPVMRTLVRTGIYSRPLMEWVLRVMANLLRPEERGIGERAYRLVERAVEIGPEP
ncbi:MAG: FAD-dependent oxidoreductase, partial [Acidimicrobiia bacterium]